MKFSDDCSSSSKNLFSLNIVTIERHIGLSDPFLNLSFGKEREAVRFHFEGLVKVWIVSLWNCLKTVFHEYKGKLVKMSDHSAFA